jgi:hypothetical protein
MKVFRLSSRYRTLAQGFAPSWRWAYDNPLSPQQALFGASLGPCRGLCPTEGATEAKHVPSQLIVKNRILRQLSADERKSVLPWLTRVELSANAVILEQGGDRSDLFSARRHDLAAGGHANR